LGDLSGTWRPQNDAQLKKYQRLVMGSVPVHSTVFGPEDLSVPQVEHPIYQASLLPAATVALLKDRFPAQMQSQSSLKGSTLPRLPGASNRSVTLEGFALLKACSVQFPEEGRRADISAKGYTKVAAADLDYFTRLAVLNASANFLTLEHFNRLPNLQELQLACNGLTDLLPQMGFEKLYRLDLSYNSINPETIGNLAFLPRLKHLDLTSNGLSALPENMEIFQTLEVLLLEHNQFEGPIPPCLANIPRLRELHLAFNFIDVAPLECAADGKYPALDLMDLAFNYIEKEKNILPLAQLPQLTRLILYGNPLAGPTGEDPGGTCIQKFLFLAERFRQGWIERPLEVILEQPRKKVLDRVNRRPYRDVETVAIDEKLIPSAAEFKEAGNKIVFGGKKAEFPSMKLLENDFAEKEGFFVTGIDMGGELPPEEPYIEQEEPTYQGGSGVPTLLLQRPVVANPRADPAKLSAAITALRFALRNPINTHASGAAAIDAELAGKAVIKVDRPTAAALNRSVPRRPYELRNMTQKGKMTTMQEEKQSLNQIERVLDSMNDRMEVMHQGRGGGGKGTSHRTAGMASLITMVNTVVDELAEK